MSIYQSIDGQIVEVIPSTFSALGIKERTDTQQLLKQQIRVIAPNTLIIAEEFGDWEDSRPVRHI